MNNGKELKTRYSDKELQEFDQLILAKLNEAKEQLNFYRQQMNEMGESEESKVRGLDDGTGTAESERLLSMAARTNKYIKHLENARLRIQNKVYGVCRVSGKLISKERLKAVPHATLSIEAKQKGSA